MKKKSSVIKSNLTPWGEPKKTWFNSAYGINQNDEAIRERRREMFKKGK